MSKFVATFKMPQEKYDALKRIMDMDIIDFEKETVPYDAEIESIREEFKNGISIVWGMYTGQHNAWAEAFLVDKHGETVMDFYDNVMFDITGAEIYYKGNTYILHIERE